ncbi:MAG: hypothetical protein K0U38_01435 [Epsilonproteobacteria bacterium]|nr:hypothetical protein [Campylobacterota bacterium]
MPTPQLDKEVEELRDEIITTSPTWSVRHMFDRMTDMIDKSYNLGVTSTIERVGVDLREIEQELLSIGMEKQSGIAIKRIDQALSTLKQELLTNLKDK